MKYYIVFIILLLIMQFLYFNNKINNIKNQSKTIKIQDNYLTLGKTGQLFITPDNNLSLYGFVNKNLEIGTGGDIIINAGKDKLELRVGNSNKIKITEDRIDITSKEVYINNQLIN